MGKKIRLIGIIGSVVLLSWWITQPKKLNESTPAPTIVSLAMTIPFDNLFPIQLQGDSTSNQKTANNGTGLTLGSFTSVAALQKAFSSQSMVDTLTILKVSDYQNNLWYYPAIGPFKSERALQKKQKELQAAFGMQPSIIVWPSDTTKQKYKLKL